MAAAASSATPLFAPRTRRYGATHCIAAATGPSPAVRAVLVRSDVLPRQILGFLPPLEALRLRLVNKAWSKAFVRKDDALWWLDNAATAVARDAAAVAVASSPAAAASAGSVRLTASTKPDEVLFCENEDVLSVVLRLEPGGGSEMPPLPASADRDVYLFWLYLRASTIAESRRERAKRILSSVRRPYFLRTDTGCCMRHFDELLLALMWAFPLLASVLLPFQLQRVFDVACVSHAYGWRQLHANVTDPLPFPSVLPDSLALNSSSLQPFRDSLSLGTSSPLPEPPRVNWTFLNASLIDCGMDYTSLGFSMDPSGLPHDHWGASLSIAFILGVSIVVTLFSTSLAWVLGGNHSSSSPHSVPLALWRFGPCMGLCSRRGSNDWQAFDAGTSALGSWLLVPLVLSWCAVFPDDRAPGTTTAVALTAVLVVFALVLGLWRRRRSWMSRRRLSVSDSEWLDRAAHVDRFGSLSMALLCFLGAQCAMVALNQALYWGCWWLGIPPAPPSDVPFRARDNPLPIDVMLIPSIIPVLVLLMFGCYTGLKQGVNVDKGGSVLIVNVLLYGGFVGFLLDSLQRGQSVGGASWYAWTTLSPFLVLMLALALALLPVLSHPVRLIPPDEGGRFQHTPGAHMNEALMFVNQMLHEELIRRRNLSLRRRSIASHGEYDAFL
jgi:hypothetical protein